MGERGGTHSNDGGQKIPPDKGMERDTGQDIEMEHEVEEPRTSSKGKSSSECHKTVTWKRSFIEVVQGREEHVAENKIIDPPLMIEGNYQIEIDRVEEKNTEKEWGHCLVGSFQGVTFKKHILQSRLMGIWRTREAFKVVPLDQGNYLFRFDDLEDRLGVLMGGPWFVGHHRLRLRLWDVDFDPDDDKISQVPIWIRLQNLPLKFWNNDTILKIVAAVGRPLKLDTFTATKQSGCFARICVEVDLDKPLTRGVMLKSSTKTKWQSILYEDVPEICSFCMFTGHSIKQCKRKVEELIQTHPAENTVESQPPSSALSAKADDNPWSVAVRTRRRPRRPVKDGGRKIVAGNSFADQGVEGGLPHQLRDVTTNPGKPSQANPLLKEKIVEQGQVEQEKRPRIVKEVSGMVETRKDGKITVPASIPGEQFETVQNRGKNHKKYYTNRTPVAVESQAGNGSSGIEDGSHPGNRFLALDIEDNTATMPAPDNACGLLAVYDSSIETHSATTIPSQSHPIQKPLPPMLNDTIPAGPFLIGPKSQPVGPNLLDPIFAFGVAQRPAAAEHGARDFNTQLSSQLVTMAAVPRTSISDAELVVDITPCRVEDETEVRNQEMVVFEQYSNDSRMAKDLRLDRMDFCRLTGNKTKGNGEYESLPNSQEKGRYQKANKLAKTRSTR